MISDMYESTKYE